MIRMVLDTNVIVSALVFGGIPRGVLELAEAGQCQFFYSLPIQTEVRRVLSEKFDWPQAMLRQALPVLWRMGQLVVAPHRHSTPSQTIPTTTASSSALSKPRHNSSSPATTTCLALQNYKSISIVTPRRFIEVFLAP